MIAIEIREPGGPDVLMPVERVQPAPGPGEVLVAVAAAGVNRPDIMQRQGKYPPPPQASDIPGLEIAGRVEALGDGVTDLRVGDQVCALVTGGGYAEYCVAPAPQCLKLPAGLTHVSAAAIPETFFTVWSNVFERGRLEPGEWLLVHGGSGGIGTAAIQLARAIGSRVIATAGTAEKCAVCEQLGAERAINYRETDFVAAVRDLTGGHGADVILDVVGGDYLPRNIEALATDGRLVQIGVQGGRLGELDLMRVLRHRLTISGSTLRARSVAEKGAIAQALLLFAWPLIESGIVTPVVYTTFPLREAASAHRVMESGVHIGKIVLVVAEAARDQRA